MAALIAAMRKTETPSDRLERIDRVIAENRAFIKEYTVKVAKQREEVLKSLTKETRAWFLENEKSL